MPVEHDQLPCRLNVEKPLYQMTSIKWLYALWLCLALLAACGGEPTRPTVVPTETSADPTATVSVTVEATAVPTTNPTQSTVIPTIFQGLEEVAANAGLTSEQLNQEIQKIQQATLFGSELGMSDLVPPDSSIQFETLILAYFQDGNFEGAYRAGDAIVVDTEGYLHIYSSIVLDNGQQISVTDSHHLTSVGGEPLTEYVHGETIVWWSPNNGEGEMYVFVPWVQDGVFLSFDEYLDAVTLFEAQQQFPELGIVAVNHKDGNPNNYLEAVDADGVVVAISPDATSAWELVQPTQIQEWGWADGEELPPMHFGNSEFVDNGDGSGYISVLTEAGEIQIPISISEGLVDFNGNSYEKTDLSINIQFFREETNERLTQTQPKVEIRNSENDAVCFFDLETGEYQPVYETIYTNPDPIAEGVPGTWASDFGLEAVVPTNSPEAHERNLAVSGQVRRIFTETMRWIVNPPSTAQIFPKPADSDYVSITFIELYIGNGNTINVLVAGEYENELEVIGLPQAITVTNNAQNPGNRQLKPYSLYSNQEIVQFFEAARFVEVYLDDWIEPPHNGLGYGVDNPEFITSKFGQQRYEALATRGNEVYGNYYAQQQLFDELVAGSALSHQGVPVAYSALIIVTE